MNLYRSIGAIVCHGITPFKFEPFDDFTYMKLW